MAKIFTGQPISYPKGHVISEVLAFLKDYPDYSTTLLRILFNVKKQNEQMMAMIEREIQVSKLGGSIVNLDQVKNFTTLVVTLYQREKNRGNMFNQFITQVGPFIIDETSYVNESCVNNKNSTVISPKNYDVIYSNVNSYQQMNQLRAELIECKIAVDNYFFNSYDERLRSRGKERLEFFAETREALAGAEQCEIVLVTLQADVTEVEELVKLEGYSWVKFIKWREIVNGVRAKFFTPPSSA